MGFCPMEVSSTPLFDLETMRRYLASRQARLWPGEVLEMRVLFASGRGALSTPIYKDSTVEEILGAVRAFLQYSNEIYNFYTTVNSRHYSGYGRFYTHDSDITRLLYMVLDIDSKKHNAHGEKIGNCMASETERHAAHRAARTIITWMKHNFGLRDSDYTLVDSGNGAQIHINIDLPIAGNANTLSRILNFVKSQLPDIFETEDLQDFEFDTKVGNPATLMRFAGTMNRKPLALDGRPYRPSSILHAPDVPTIFDLESLLEDMAAQEPPAREAKTSGSAGFYCEDFSISLSEFCERYLGCNIVNGRCACPFHGGSNPSSLVFRDSDTAVCFSGCSSSNGKKRIWSIGAAIQFYRKSSYREAMEWAEKEGLKSSAEDLVFPDASEIHTIYEKGAETMKEVVETEAQENGGVEMSDLKRFMVEKWGCEFDGKFCRSPFCEEGDFVLMQDETRGVCYGSNQEISLEKAREFYERQNASGDDAESVIINGFDFAKEFDVSDLAVRITDEGTYPVCVSEALLGTDSKGGYMRITYTTYPESLGDESFIERCFTDKIRPSAKFKLLALLVALGLPTKGFPRPDQLEGGRVVITLTTRNEYLGISSIQKSKEVK